MPSPFPGMDPYLESRGDLGDFHARFLTYWSEMIADAIPDDYEVRIDERLRVVAPDGDNPRRMLADVAFNATRVISPQLRPPTGVATLEPVAVPRPHLRSEEPPDRFIKIFKRSRRQLVTVLELLLPTNKAGRDRDEYLAKRHELMYRNIHLVELDLLIRGQRLPMGAPLPPGDYYAIVSRGDIWPDSQVYAWSVRQPLPSLPIPLSAPDPDAWVDLAKVFTTVYERGRYARFLSYDEPIPVPLRDEDREWALDVVKATRPVSPPRA